MRLSAIESACSPTWASRSIPTRSGIVSPAASACSTAAGASGLAAAARLADRYGLIPPDHGGIYGVGETLTYGSQRLLMSLGSRAREFAIRSALIPPRGYIAPATLRGIALTACSNALAVSTTR